MPVKMIVLEEVTVIEVGDEKLKVSSHKEHIKLVHVL
jgi:hypothetical protein